MIRTERGVRQQSEVLCEPSVQILKVVGLICKIYPFLDNSFTTSSSASPQSNNNEARVRLVQLLAAHNLHCYGRDELLQISANLRQQFTDSMPMVSETKELLLSKLSHYLEQVRSILFEAEEQSGWIDIGSCTDSSPLIGTILANQFDSSSHTRYRIVPTHVDPNSIEVTYMLQSRSMTHLDFLRLRNQKAYNHARCMVYYRITGQLPDENTNWQVASDAIETGTYRHYDGFNRALYWSDMSAILMLASEYVTLQNYHTQS
jgi:hypothetical protein